ncbi:MAG: signal recognition particle receptor FtsY [Armatimonadota bacterium]|nr:MAG: signal recognition particle receptor FtsY [Armatimonadota bacterium]
MPLGIFKGLLQKVDTLLTGRGRVDEELFEELEGVLLTADINVHTTMQVLDDLRRAVREQRLKEPSEVKTVLKESLLASLRSGGEAQLKVSPEPPTVYLFVGVNGVGKTTSIAKLAYRLRQQDKSVILAAGDTFRAAAIDQLEIWAQRVGATLVKHREGADPSAVIYDAIAAARNRGVDYVLADTAGRLHTRSNLMEELKKVYRVTERALGRPPDEVLLVLDATTGQNAIRQAEEFMQAVNVTGIVLAKLDGTARGGAVITIHDELKVPIKLVGVGEKPEDLEDFDAEEYVAALLGNE